MPIGSVGGPSSNQPFGGGGIQGKGSNFSLRSIKDQFKVLNAKFDELKAKGNHDPQVIKKLESDVKKLHAPLKATNQEIDQELKVSLDKLLKEIAEWKAQDQGKP